MLVRVEAPPRDLSPTSAINNLLALLRDILSTASMSEGRDLDMIKVKNCKVETIKFNHRTHKSRLEKSWSEC